MWSGEEMIIWQTAIISKFCYKLIWKCLELFEILEWKGFIIHYTWICCLYKDNVLASEQKSSSDSCIKLKVLENV
jgi:hypothetical protein